MGLLQSTFSGEEFLPVLSGNEETVKDNLSANETGSASQRCTDLTSREDNSVKIEQPSYDTNARCEERTNSCSDVKASFQATPSSVRRRKAVLSNQTIGKSCDDGNSATWIDQMEGKKKTDGFPDSQDSFCIPKQGVNKQRYATKASEENKEPSTRCKSNQVKQNQAFDNKTINIREQEKSVPKNSTTNKKPIIHCERSQGAKNSEAQVKEASKVSSSNQKPLSHTKPNQGTSCCQERAKDKQQDVCKASLPNQKPPGYREPCQKTNNTPAKTKDKVACKASLLNQKPSSLRESCQVTNYSQEHAKDKQQDSTKASVPNKKSPSHLERSKGTNFALEEEKDKQHNYTKASLTNHKPANYPESTSSTYNCQETSHKQTNSAEVSVTKQKLSSQGKHYNEEQAVDNQQDPSKSVQLKSQTSKGHLEPKVKQQQAVTSVKTCSLQVQETCTKPKTALVHLQRTKKTMNKGVADQKYKAEIKIASSETQEQDLCCPNIIPPNKDTQFVPRSTESNCIILNCRGSAKSSKLQTCSKPPTEAHQQRFKESQTPKVLDSSPKVTANVTASTTSLVNKDIISSDNLGSKTVMPSKDLQCTGAFTKNEQTCVFEDKKSNYEATKNPERKTSTDLIECTKRIESDGSRQFLLIDSKNVSGSNQSKDTQTLAFSKSKNGSAASSSKEAIKPTNSLLNRKTCNYAQENLETVSKKESCSNKDHTPSIVKKDCNSGDPVLKEERPSTSSLESPTCSSKRGSIRNWSTSDVREHENKLAYRVIKRTPQKLQGKNESSQDFLLKSGRCDGDKKPGEQGNDHAKSIKDKVSSQHQDSPLKEQRAESTLTKDRFRGSPLMRLSMKDKEINLERPLGSKQALTNDKKPLKTEGVPQAQFTLSGTCTANQDSQKDTNQSQQGRDQFQESRSKPNDPRATQKSDVSRKSESKNAVDSLKSTIILDQLAEKLEKLNITTCIVTGNSVPLQAPPEAKNGIKECPTNSSQQRCPVERISRVTTHQPVSYSTIVRSVPCSTLTKNGKLRKDTALRNDTDKETVAAQHGATAGNCHVSSISNLASSKSVQISPKNVARANNTGTTNNQNWSTNFHQTKMVANTSGKDARNLSESKGVKTAVEKGEPFLKCFTAGSKVLEKREQNNRPKKEDDFLNVSNARNSTTDRGINATNSALPTQTAIKPQTDVKAKLQGKDQELTLNETHSCRSTTSIQSEKQCSSSYSPSGQKNVQSANGGNNQPQISVFGKTNAIYTATKPLSSTKGANIFTKNKQDHNAMSVGLNSISELDVEGLNGAQENLTKKEVSSVKHEKRFLGNLKNKMSSVFGTKKGKKTCDGKKTASAVKVPSPPALPPKPASDCNPPRESAADYCNDTNEIKQPYGIVDENKHNASMAGLQFHSNKHDDTNNQEAVSSAERGKVTPHPQGHIPNQLGEVKTKQSVSTSVGNTTQRQGAGKCVFLEEKGTKTSTQAKQTSPTATKIQEPSADKKSGAQITATQVMKEYCHISANVEEHGNIPPSKARSVSSKQSKVSPETALQNKNVDVPKGKTKESSNSPIFVKSKNRKETKPVAEVSRKVQGIQIQKTGNHQESKIAATAPHTAEKKEDAVLDYSKMAVEDRSVQGVDICAEVAVTGGESTCVGASPSKKAERRERRRLKRQQKRAMERMSSEQGESVCEESLGMESLMTEAAESNSSTKARSSEVFQAISEKNDSLLENEVVEEESNNEENFQEIENPLAAINLTPLKEKPIPETSPQSKTSRRRGGRRRRGKYEYITPVSRRKPINCCCEVVCEYCSSPRDN